MTTGLSIDSETPFDRFSLPRPGRRTKLCLRDVLPSVRSDSYCVLLTPFQVKLHDEIVEVGSFDTLFSHVGLARSETNLAQVLEGRVLMEGPKKLDREIAEKLVASPRDDSPLFVRCSDPPDRFLWRVERDEFLRSEDVLKFLPHSFGEFEVTDERTTWYMRIRDENPLIFLASSDELVAGLERDCSRVAMKLSGAFMYAP